MTIEEIKQLGQHHLPEFQSLALMLTRDEDRARDLLQDAIYLVLKNRSAFRPGSNFVAWVKTIIRNTFISEYRRGKRRQELLHQRRPVTGWIMDLVVDNPAESELGAEDIMALIQQLPVKYRKAFLLHFRGTKYKDIAVMTGVPIGTAKSRVYTARMILREQLIQRGVSRGWH